MRMLFIGAPLLYAVLLGYVYNKGKVTNLPIIVVDEDQSVMSRKLVSMIEDNEVLSIASLRNDKADLNHLLLTTQAASVVLIPKDFEKQVLTKRCPEITTMVNTANILTANYASGALQVCLGTLKAGVQLETLRKQGVPESQLMSQYEPFKTTFIKKNNRSTNYMYFLWPGVLAAVLQQVLLLGLALSFTSEYENNTFAYLVSKTKSTLKLIVVKVVPYLVMSLGVWLMYWGFTFWFDIPFKENLLPLTLIAGVFVLATCFIGILVSIVLPGQLQATEVLMVVATPSFILSGFTWPLSQMPLAVQYIANAIPLTHFLQAFRILIVEQGDVSYTYPYVRNMAIIAGICFVLSYIALYLKRKKLSNNTVVMRKS